MQGLMPDSQFPEPERRVQPLFRKSSLLNGLALAGVILALAVWMRLNRPSLDLAPAEIAAGWRPVTLPSLRDPRARLAGAWELVSTDARLGGFSGLAIDGDRLLALSDSGRLAWLPRPGAGASKALLKPLPATAGDPRKKIGRDSEGLAFDGQGWWVAFEQHHQRIRFDRHFERALGRVAIASRGFRPNRGVEAIAVEGGRVRLFREADGISDAAALPSTGVVLLERRFGPLGFRSRLTGLGRGPLVLPLGPLDNAEGLAAEWRPGGGVRLWVITDNDNRRWRRTLLVAIDLPADAAQARR